MDWVTAVIFSSLLLGCYDLCIKHAVRDNAVLPVLFLSNLCSATLWIMVIGVDRSQALVVASWLHVTPMTGVQHAMLFGKSALVAGAWTCSYFAMKHLPLSLASPIRSMAPLVTFAGALLLLGERLNGWQAAGVLVTLSSFLGLSLVGRREGIHFERNHWIWILILGTFFNGLSGLYDKFLLGRIGLTAPTLQAWFSIYLAIIFLPLALGWKLRLWPRNHFLWRTSILGVSLFLLLADYLYFSALQNPEAMVSIVSSVRRGSALVSFAGGVFLYREVNGWRKLPAVVGILAGIVLMLVH
ncbi:MAG: DMT family transporter [Opitutaceae bacterium]|nr:DMT family transporter [Opitutaceae bacterium]